MPRITNVQKFRGDNSQSYREWSRSFEVQLAANGIVDDRKRDILLCCCDETAFTVAVRLVIIMVYTNKIIY